MEKLTIKDLHVNVEGKEVLKGVTLEIKKGQVHALMGPNGAGKSSLGQILMGNPRYEITKGQILLDDKNITELPPNERAKLGLFMSFQYPAEVSGVTLSNFLRIARNSVKGESMGVIDFHKLLKHKMEELSMDSSFAKRYINQGFSGGEKKRSEILQMSILEPKYAILDECDSGTDVDSLKIISEGINKMRSPQCGILIITHYYRILHYLTPDVVSVMINGKIVKTGGKALAEEIDKKGFDAIKLEA